MKFLKKKNTELSLEVTPLIDIVFLLLISYFNVLINKGMSRGFVIRTLHPPKRKNTKQLAVNANI